MHCTTTPPTRAVRNEPPAPSRLRHRWVFLQTDLLLEDQLQAAEAILPRAAAAGYNGVVLSDGKLSYLDSLGTLGPTYLPHLAEFRARAEALGLDIIPLASNPGTAGGLLLHDPDLAEGMPVSNVPYAVSHGVATLVPDPGAALANGDFQETAEGRLAGFELQEGFGSATVLDPGAPHNGHPSLRMEPSLMPPSPAPMERIAQQVNVIPGHQYRLSVWVRTAGFSNPGNAGVYVLDPTGRELAYGRLAAVADQDWTLFQTAFVPPRAGQIAVYFGVWGTSAGSLWWADATLESVGLLNIVRRPACPLRVSSADGHEYKEGVDYAAFRDPFLGKVPWPGSFSVAQAPPRFTLPPGSGIKENTWIWASGTVAKVFGASGAAACLGSPAVAALYAKEINNQAASLGPAGIFFGHSEIPILDQDADCQELHLDAGPLLAGNLHTLGRLVEQARPGSEMYVWSDMVNPYQNARRGYDLVKGDLEGAWVGLPRRLVIVNWDFQHPAESVSFFEGLGLDQILAGYYDGQAGSISEWLAQARMSRGLAGVMYTTWVGDYSALEAFAQAAFPAPSGRATGSSRDAGPGSPGSATPSRRGGPQTRMPIQGRSSGRGSPASSPAPEPPGSTGT